LKLHTFHSFWNGWCILFLDTFNGLYCYPGCGANGTQEERLPKIWGTTPKRRSQNHTQYANLITPTVVYCFKVDSRQCLPIKRQGQISFQISSYSLTQQGEQSAWQWAYSAYRDEAPTLGAIDPMGLFTYHGNWCGPNSTDGHKKPWDQLTEAEKNNCKSPTDELDTCCETHDNAMLLAVNSTPAMRVHKSAV